ncbi:hypothetical protein BX666DRAFT_2023520 [Dichotomocladium elegans]|nr:hypothetical protein BX666DRAFT_2023520 [Dichotomocladium elegans]
MKPKKERQNAATTTKQPEHPGTNIFRHLINAQSSREVNVSETNYHQRRSYTNLEVPKQNEYQKCLIDTGPTLSTITVAMAEPWNSNHAYRHRIEIIYGNQSMQVSNRRIRVLLTINYEFSSTAHLYIVDHQNESMILGMD